MRLNPGWRYWQLVPAVSGVKLKPSFRIDFFPLYKKLNSNHQIMGIMKVILKPNSPRGNDGECIETVIGVFMSIIRKSHNLVVFSFGVDTTKGS